MAMTVRTIAEMRALARPLNWVNPSHLADQRSERTGLSTSLNCAPVSARDCARPSGDVPGDRAGTENGPVRERRGRAIGKQRRPQRGLRSDPEGDQGLFGCLAGRKPARPLRLCRQTWKQSRTGRSPAGQTAPPHGRGYSPVRFRPERGLAAAPSLGPGASRRHRRGAPPARGLDFRNRNAPPAATRTAAHRASTVRAETAARAHRWVLPARGHRSRDSSGQRTTGADATAAQPAGEQPAKTAWLDGPHRPVRGTGRRIGCFCLSSGGPVPEGRTGTLETRRKFGKRSQSGH